MMRRGGTFSHKFPYRQAERVARSFQNFKNDRNVATVFILKLSEG
jgi:hypothetical protein